VIEGAVQRRVQGAGAELALVEAGDAAAPTIVFIHGYPDTKDLWAGVLARLRGRYHVVAYDVRGAGSSTAPRDVRSYRLERLGDDLLAVLDAVSPERPAHLVGHDWGAIQGWEFATQPRFAGRLASLTAIAGPSLDQVSRSGTALLRSGRMLEALARARRSWYVLALLAPGGPSAMWRLPLGERRWRWFLGRVEGLTPEDEYPSPSLVRDALNGANLYRANIPERLLRPRSDAVAHVPVQLIVPERDRFISPAYYERAEQCAPGLRRRTIATSHWAPREDPQSIARWVGEFVAEVEAR
jgi:pimeloyl-ACP methyl ester carboxylesterase